MGIALVLVAGSCGSKNAGSGAAGAVDACNAYCIALVAKHCATPLYPSVDQCQAAECAPVANTPASCQGAVETYYHCAAGQVDICAEDGCTTQFGAVLACAGGGGSGGASPDAAVEGDEGGSAPDGAPSDEMASPVDDPCGTPPKSPGAVIVPAPAARWSGEGNASDSAGGRNGTLSPTGVSFVPGVRGQAFALDGASGWVSLPDGPVQPTARAFSVAVWVRVPVLAHRDQKIYFASPGQGEYQLMLRPGDEPTLGVHLVASDWRYVQSRCPLPAARWVFLVAVRRADALEMWIDGSLREKASVPDEDMVHFSGFSPSAIGAYPPANVAQFLFRGEVDELRLFDTALTPEQIARLYLDERPH
jgi:hypothetical protein